MRIKFDIPADPAYAKRVTAVLSDTYLRKYRYIGLGLVAVGLLGLLLLPSSEAGFGTTPIFTTVITVGVLSMLFPLWARFSARRRLDGLAVEGGYEITDRAVLMRSGGESGSLPWRDVTGVAESRGFWVLYAGKTPYTVIPQEFMSAEEQQTLRDFLVERGSIPAPPRPAA